MQNIVVKMLGNPIVKLNDKEVYFPYKKCEGLFYYVCLNKKVTRQEAINILWTDNDEVSAKKNLRDALYKIKKTLCDDVFSSKSKSVIELNDKINFKVDIYDITENNIINLYNGDFLNNFVIKNCYDFENWVTEKREDYKNIYIKSSTKKINELVNMGDFKSIQKYSNILIENDPYNEKNYRDIIRIYALSGDYNKAIKLYYDLSNILKKDLDIQPEQRTKQIFKEILKLKDNDVLFNSKSTYFYGRFDELYTINQSLHNFYLDKGKSILLSGEAGIGKTSLIDKTILSINQDKYIVLQSICYNAEEDFFLKPWHNIFSILGKHVRSEKIYLSSFQEQIISYLFPSFNKEINALKIDNIESIDTTRYNVAFNAIIELLQKLSEKKKIIIFFDDIQWMDKMSKFLLSNILSDFKNKNVLFIGAYRNNFENEMSSFTIPLINQELIHEIKLQRFSFDETKKIIEDFLPKHMLTHSFFSNIYKDTEGNALFLIELLKVVKEKGYTKELSLKATNIIKSRIMDLTDDEKNLLNIISLFFDKVSMENLKLLVEFDELAIFDIIESLSEKHLIKELITEKDIFYRFTHQKIREYIYDKQSIGKKKILHKKIAFYFEEHFKSSHNKHFYTNLIYHFEKSGDKYKALKYKVENLTDYYTIYHETYPAISSEASFFNDFSENVEKEDLFNVEEKLIEISHSLLELDRYDTEYLKMNMEISYLAGRYYISIGDYANGLKYINTSMLVAEQFENHIFLLNNYKQMIYYSIQVHEMTIMYKYINKCLNLLEKNDNIEERGNILRLKGLYYIKTKKYDIASELLNDSLNIFIALNKINNKYTLSISACYNYLGQMHKYLEEYELAYKYFIDAINLCTDRSITKGLGIFYSNAGQTLYKMNRYEESKEFILKSLMLFNNQRMIWGRDIAEGYASLIYIHYNDLVSAKEHYETAYMLANKLNNPRSLALANKIKKVLK